MRWPPSTACELRQSLADSPRADPSVPGFTIQGGDIINGDGTGIWSIYGGPFADENFNIPHSAKGLVSMVRASISLSLCALD